jgi:hypothetical protein
MEIPVKEEEDGCDSVELYATSASGSGPMSETRSIVSTKRQAKQAKSRRSRRVVDDEDSYSGSGITSDDEASEDEDELRMGAEVCYTWSTGVSNRY